MPKKRHLNLRQRKFVEGYLATGNATKAAEMAGYPCPRQAGARALSSVVVRTAIDKTVEKDGLVADRKAMQRFWTRVMQGEVDERASLNDRLRASELLAKSQRVFVQQVEVKDVSEASIEQRKADLVSAFNRIAASGSTGQVAEKPN